MANDPRKRDQLYATAHRGWIWQYQTGVEATRLLFTIHDSEWIAWYEFRELSSDIGHSMDLQLLSPGPDGPSPAISVFGRRAASRLFRPSTPLRCDEFCAQEPQRKTVWKGGHSDAHLKTTTALGGGKLLMTLSAKPYGAREDVPMVIEHGLGRPAHRENGYVYLKLIERYRAASFDSPSTYKRFL